MPSVHRRSRSPFYHASFCGPDGRWLLRSTKQTDKTKAFAVALQWDRAAKLAKRGELVEAQAREVVGDIMKHADIGETLRAISIEEHFREWLDTKKARRSAGTAERYQIVVDRFLELLGSRASKPLTALMPRDVGRFLDSRLQEGVAPRTAVFDVKTLRIALNAARRAGLIPTNPAEAVDLPAVVGVERGTFNSTEVKLLVDTATGEWKSLILLGYYTGARLSDCCRMAWDDVTFTSATLTFTQGKTGRKLTVPIHPDLLDHLESLAGIDRGETFILPGMASKTPGGRHGLSESFKRIMRKAGLNLQTVQGAGLRKISKRTFHALRHSFTSALANEGVTEELRMKLTGHTTKAVHRGYTHHQFERLRAAVGKLPGLNIGGTN
jgi:integrase